MEWFTGACQKARSPAHRLGCPSPPRDWGINISCMPGEGASWKEACACVADGMAHEYRDSDILIDENGLHVLQHGHWDSKGDASTARMSHIIQSCQRASSVRGESASSQDARGPANMANMDVALSDAPRLEVCTGVSGMDSRERFLHDLRCSALAIRRRMAKGADMSSSCADTLSEASTQGPDSADMVARDHFMSTFNDTSWCLPEMSTGAARKRRGSLTLSGVGIPKKLNRNFSPKSAAQRSEVASGMESLSLGPAMQACVPSFRSTNPADASRKQAVRYCDIRKVKAIGRGTTSEVWLCTDASTGIALAVKQMSLDKDTSRRSMAVRELVTMYGVDHVGIVTCHNVFYANNAFHMAMEMMDGGSLRDAINRSSSLGAQAIPPAALAAVTADVLLALEFLHNELEVIHRDVKPSNILLARNGIAKLGDLGICTRPGEVRADAPAKDWIGTMMYMSPERLKGNGYSFSADIWSLGLTLIEVVIGRLPLQELAPPSPAAKTKLQFWDLLDIVSNGTCPSRLLTSYGPKWAALQSLAAACLMKEASKRPSAQQLRRRCAEEEAGSGATFLDSALRAALAAWVAEGLEGPDGCHGQPLSGNSLDGCTRAQAETLSGDETQSPVLFGVQGLVEVEGSEADGWL